MVKQDNLPESLITELRRGTLTLIVLNQLQTPQYGYWLVQKLEEKKSVIEAGTLYPLLRRLEKQELLVSEWDTQESRPRKYYRISEKGKQIYNQLKAEWLSLSAQMDNFFEEDESGTH